MTTRRNQCTWYIQHARGALYRIKSHTSIDIGRYRWQGLIFSSRWPYPYIIAVKKINKNGARPDQQNIGRKWIKTTVFGFTKASSSRSRYLSCVYIYSIYTIRTLHIYTIIMCKYNIPIYAVDHIYIYTYI